MTEAVNAEPNEAETLDVPTEATTEPSTLTPEAKDRELERARKEAAKYRTRLREKEDAEKAAAEEARRAELTAEQRAKEAEEKAAAAIADAEARVKRAQREARLAQHFTRPERVIALGGDDDRFWNEDGTPNLELLTPEFTEYAATAAKPAAVTTPAPAAQRGKADPSNLADAIKAHYGG